MAFLTQVSVEPVTTGTSFVDEDEMFGFGLEFAHELIDVGLPGTNGAEVSNFSTVIVRDIGDRVGFFVNIHPDEKRSGRGRLCHG